MLGGTASEGQVGSSRWIVLPAWNIDVNGIMLNAGALIDMIRTRGLPYVQGVLAT